MGRQVIGRGPEWPFIKRDKEINAMFKELYDYKAEGPIGSSTQSNWSQTDPTALDYIKNKNPYIHGKEFTLSDTYEKGTLGWQLNPGDNLENAFSKVEYALDKLLIRDDGRIAVIVEDNGTRVNGNVIILDNTNAEVFNGSTVDGTLSVDLPYGKYNVSLNALGYDVLNTSIITDNDDSDNSISGSSAINVDVAGFDSTVLFKIEPSIIPSINTFTINEGAATSSNPNLRLNLNTTGIVDQIIISRDPSFFGASWTDVLDTSSIDYVFNYASEISLVLYVKVKNSKGESEYVFDDILMTNGIVRSDNSQTYNSIKDALLDVVEEHPNGLIEDITLNVISEVYNVADVKFLIEISKFNQGTEFTLHIKGNKLLTLDCVTTGGFRLDYCDNIIFSGINMINVGSLKDHSLPEQLPAFFINRCNNVLIDDCVIDGRWLTDGNYGGRYAVVVKYNNNFTLSNTDIQYFGLTPVTVKDTVAVTFKKFTISNCSIIRGLISQPALVELANIEYLVVQDSVIDGSGMDTCFSGNNITRSYFERTKLFNCPGEIVAFTNTKKSEIFSLKNCLLYNNLTNPFYFWTKQQIALGTVDNVELLNNTIQLTAIKGSNFYARLIKSAYGGFEELNMYNNVFDYYMPAFTDNIAEASLFEVQTLGAINSDYNLYRDYSTDSDTISNLMFIIQDEESPVYINRINSLTELQSIGVDVNSTVISTTDQLFVNNDFLDLDVNVLSLPINPEHAPEFDIDKYVEAPDKNVGAKYSGSIVGLDTTIINYKGKNIAFDSEFDQTNSEHIGYSDSLLLISVDKYNDNEIYKWIFTDNYGAKVILYGNNIGVRLLSQLDNEGLYTEDSIYSIEIINI